MITKTQKAVDLYKKGDFKGSLKLFSRFKIGLSLDQRETLRIAHECCSGFVSFYNQLGIDTDSVVKDAKEIIENYVATYDIQRNEK